MRVNGKLKKNIFQLIAIKGLSSFIGFIMVPLTLNYLEPSKYGIWLTLSSIMGWIGLLDLGLANGLRNKLGEAWTKNNNNLARTFVSSTYAAFVLIVLLANLIFWLIYPFLDWVSILNIDVILLDEVRLLVVIIFSLFTLRMIFGVILTILSVDHRPALADFIVLMGSLFTLALIYLLTTISNNSLLLMGISLSIIPPIFLLISSVWFFNKDYRLISPSFSFINLAKIKEIGSLSINFFIMQIASLVLTMTDMIIISRLYGPEEVVPYNISYRLFGYVFVVFHLIVTPFWSAYNEAYFKKDFIWIRSVTVKLIRGWFILIFGVIFMILISGFIYPIWIGEKIFIPKSLSFFMGIFVIVQSFNAIFSTFIFSTGKLRVLTIMAIFVGVINIPLCFILAETFQFGVLGIILATIICTLCNAIVAFIQYHKIIREKDDKIWAK